MIRSASIGGWDCQNIPYAPELGSASRRLKSRKGGLNIASLEKAAMTEIS